MHLLVPLLMASGCGVSREPPNSQLDGTFEVFGVTIGSETIDADAFIEKGFAGCSWGRMIWTFTADEVAVGYDVLCPEIDPVEYGCRTRVAVKPEWESPARFRIPYFASSESSMVDLTNPVPREAGASPARTQCKVSLQPRAYDVIRVKNERWDWELKGEDGVIFQLNVGEPNPDFSRALQTKLTNQGGGE